MGPLKSTKGITSKMLRTAHNHRLVTCLFKSTASWRFWWYTLQKRDLGSSLCASQQLIHRARVRTHVFGQSNCHVPPAPISTSESSSYLHADKHLCVTPSRLQTIPYLTFLIYLLWHGLWTLSPWVACNHILKKFCTFRGFLKLFSLRNYTIGEWTKDWAIEGLRNSPTGKPVQTDRPTDERRRDSNTL